MEKPMTVPNEIQNICRAMAKVAQENGLKKCSGKFRPDYNVWDADVSWAWEEGRHGEDMNRITIYSDFIINTKVHL